VASKFQPSSDRGCGSSARATALKKTALKTTLVNKRINIQLPPMNLAKTLAPITTSAATHQIADSPDNLGELVAQSLRLPSAGCMASASPSPH
jgi:hypothetical protein